jgi:sulfatase maturation enzyme AslB (radical SAM superfamily)
MEKLSLTKHAQVIEETKKRYYTPFKGRYYKYLSFRKLFNALIVEYEIRRRKKILRGKPYVLHLELSNICNLNCPGCVTGSGRSKIPKGFLSFDNAKIIIDKLADYLVFVRLDGTGESLLNKDFFKIVKYLHDRGIGTVVSTNFLTAKEQTMDAIIDSGLDYLIISVDGATQEIYGKYRVGGDLDKALSNMRSIIEKKKKLGARFPFVEWQYLIFEYNEHEMPRAQELSAEIGVDRFLTKNCKKQKNVKGVPKSEPPTDLACYWLWKVLNVNRLGDCKACCTDGLAEDFTIGNILHEDLDAMWNGENFQKLRELFISDQNNWESIRSCKCSVCGLVHRARNAQNLAPIKF